LLCSIKTSKKVKLKTRIKTVLKSVRNRILSQSNTPSQEPEPTVVIDKQLLTGKNVLITGAGRNIGRNIAIEMAKQGANIFFTDIDEERYKKVEEELSDYPIKSIGFVSDISKIQDIDSLYRSLIKDEIKIDILVNNAALQSQATANNLSLESWHEAFNTNLFGPMHLTRLISEMMISNNIPGVILFLTSVHQWTVKGDLKYTTSKAALGMVVKELAIELAPHNIRVNGIAPGWVKENEYGKPFPSTSHGLHKTSINPCYIGRAAVYLAADYFSKFTTGTVLKIDAGLTLFTQMPILKNSK